MASSPTLKKFFRAAGILVATAASIGTITPAKAIMGCSGQSLGMATWGEIKGGGFTCVVGDKTYSNFTYSATSTGAGFSGIDDGDVFSFSTIGALGLTHNLNVQSANSYKSAIISLGYTVARSSGVNTFDHYSANITGDNGTNWALSVAATNAPVGPGGSPSQTTGYPTLAQVATTPNVSFNNGTISSNFSNTLQAGATGAGVTQFSNRLVQKEPMVQTPGPLPLLGAGAAFGFSRKLRSRVKLAA